MMLNILLLLIASIGLTAAEPVRVGIFLQQPESTSSEILDSFRNEVQRIVARPGTQLIWRQAIGGNESFHRILVVRLHGSCSAALPGRLGRPASLGSTHVNNGKVQPFIDISCEQVITAMSRGWNWPTSSVSSEIYGRALARVAAHEIYHALTESVEHDEEGLMKSSFDRLDLCSGSLRLAPTSAARLERALGLALRAAD